MKERDYGKAHRYAHNEPNACAVGENYLQEPLQGHRYYFPVEQGMEIKVAEKLAMLRRLDEEAAK
jgi:putative ATPase